MRVLVVEDEPVLADVVQRGLREEGYAVDREHTLAGADHAVAVNAYDVVVLDLGLPDGNGLDLCRAIRTAGLPARVLALTARGSVDDKVAGLDAGADDYLTKPFDFAELAARVRALVRRPAATGGTRLQVGQLRLDPAARRVWQGDVLIPLTAKEFGLLHVLMSRPGHVVTRSELLEHVWDEHYDGLSNVVDVHIASLRRKLGGEDRSPAIQTVRGAGYRVEP